jgi:hypothetical protein
MKPEDLVKKTIRESDLHVDECVHQTILADALQRLRTVTYKPAVDCRPPLWRLIMKNPMTKIAVAGIVCIILGVCCWDGPLDGTTAAFAAVKQAVESMPLVHRTLDRHRDGRHYHSETWYAFETRTVVSKYLVDGRCYKISSLNYDTMENYAYDPNTDIVKRSYRTDVSTNLLSDSPWSIVEEHLQEFEREKATVERRQEMYEANKVDVYHFLIPQNFRDEKVEGEFVVNHESQLPILYKSQYWNQQGDLIYAPVLRFDFPESGPNDVYDLGVPRSARMVYDADSKALLALKAKLLQDKRTYEKAFNKEQKKNKTYHLDEGQVLKHLDQSLVRPRARIDWANDMLRYFGSRSVNQNTIEKEFKRTDRYMAFAWDDQLVRNRAAVFKDGVSLQEAFKRIVGLSKFEYQIPDTLLDVKIKGDWIVRKGATKTQKLKAFERIVQARVKRPIRFKQHSVERDVIVASGTFRFKPLSNTYDNKWIHVFSDVMDPDERGGGGSGTPEEFLRSLGDIPLSQQVLNETDPSGDTRLNWGWHYSGYLRKVEDDVEKQEKLTMLLGHLSQQTGLTFKQERRNVKVWTVSERTD